MSEKRKIVSKVPEITPELLEANEAEQGKWRQMFVLPETNGASYADLTINSNLNILDALASQLKYAKGSLKKEIKTKSLQLREDTAVWAESIGKFALAHALTNDKRRRRHYKECVEAIARDDGEWCAHPIFEHINGQLSQVAYRELNFHSEKHGRTVSMVRCRICGFRNAKDLNAELAKISDYRAETVAHGDKRKDTKTLDHIFDNERTR
jgi:hypothetical protein